MSENETAVLYARVSTAKQATDGVSLDQQRSSLEGWAKQHGYTHTLFYVDEGKSGKDLRRRPQAQEAIAQACAYKAQLVIYSLSRLCRSLKDACEIVERLLKGGGTLVSLKESIDLGSPSGRMVYGIMSVVNQFQREVIAETTKDNMAHIKASGCHTGACSFGWKPDKARPVVKPLRDGATKTHYPYTIEDPVEQTTLRAIVAAHEKHGNCWQRIANEVNAAGHVNRAGKPFKRGEVRHHYTNYMAHLAAQGARK
jgi:DNA invertase Pin-like site-specific DNA recombinase